MAEPKPRRARYEQCLIDGSSSRDPLTLIISSDERPFVIYHLDRESVAWEGKRPDGVLIADLGDAHLICFLELKATMKGDSAVLTRAFDQLRGGVAHFCPAGRHSGVACHGDVHHDAWRDGDDGLPILPSRRHLVVCAAIGFRQAPPRPLPHREAVTGKDIPYLLTTVSMEGYNRARVTLEDLCRKLGLRA